MSKLLNNKKIYSFIILHYLNQDVTINCIKSIIKYYSNNNIFIVVVDNASPNNSLEIIKDYFEGNDNISYIRNSTNLGFAKANNIGISFAKNKFNSDFYIVINSDIEFIQESFLDKINEIYSRVSFDILGPDILQPFDGDYLHSSPHSLDVPNKKSVEESLLSLYIKKLRLKICFFDIVLPWIMKPFKILIRHNTINTIDYSKEYLMPKLQGSCYVFSKKYILSKNKVFCEDIFFYGEEEATSYYAKIENRIVIYSPRVKVIHKAYGSLNKALESNNENDKKIYIINSYIEAYKVLKKIMNNK